MSESLGADLVQGPLSRMAERSVTKIMSQGDRFSQIFIQAQGFGDRSGVLRHLQRVRHARSVMVAVRRQKDLGLILKSSEGFAMKDTVPVPLKNRPDVTLLFGRGPAL